MPKGNVRGSRVNTCVHALSATHDIHDPALRAFTLRLVTRVYGVVESDLFRSDVCGRVWDWGGGKKSRRSRPSPMALHGVAQRIVCDFTSKRRKNLTSTINPIIIAIFSTTNRSVFSVTDWKMFLRFYDEIMVEEKTTTIYSTTNGYLVVV